MRRPSAACSARRRCREREEEITMDHIDPVSLARLQFAMTALYHFLFVPLTLGLSFLLAIMESAYVMTGRQIWRDMTRFWGKLFGINFAMGVATGITMEFQFGTNWAYYLLNGRHVAFAKRSIIIASAFVLAPAQFSTWPRSRPVSFSGFQSPCTR